MSCFGCCGDNDIHKAADTGRFVGHHSAGDSVYQASVFSSDFMNGSSYSLALKK